MFQQIYPTIQAAVTRWMKVEAAPHRFGGVEFQWQKVEIGHVHRNGMVDIPFTRKLRDALLEENLVHPHHLLPDTGWISFYIRQGEDEQRAIDLLHLSYLQKTRRRQPDPATEDAIAALPFSANVKQAAFGMITEA